MGSFELIKFRDNELELDVNVSPEEDTIWLTQGQMAILFEKNQGVISRHINDVFKEGELDKGTSMQKMHKSPDEINPNYRPPVYYNLDVVISVGYRVKSKRGVLFRKWANNILKQYLLKGYIVDGSRVTVSKESFFELESSVKQIKEEIEEIKEKTFIEPVKQRLFYDGEYFDAYDFICSLIANAKNSVILIDPYFDETGLHYLNKRKDKVKLRVCVSSNSKLDANDIKQFKKQYGQIDIVKKDVFHDRYLIIDNSMCYSLGASLNHMGKRVFSVNLIEDKDIVRLIIDKLGA